ncbi:Cytochrome P450 2J3 [Folsomia candida]|uniref:Cytochrome P450 2J3 n=2 Tax=Folsomia candida TaxID=158441 RepID=A0A226DE46_FOLCA|nr:Cytochrome P450 2J3 [Folsomia candida]
MFLEIGSLIFATLLFLWIYLSQKRPANFPPGPMGIPIFGYLPFLGATPHKKLGEIGTKWGPIFSLYYGSYPIVVLNTLPMIKDALRRDTFSGRPNHLLAMKLSRDGITFNDGPAGYEQRRFTLKTLRDLGFGKQSMEKLVEEEVHELVDYFGKNTNKPIELKHIFGLFVINALWSILVGDKFSVNDVRIQELYRMCIE